MRRILGMCGSVVLFLAVALPVAAAVQPRVLINGKPLAVAAGSPGSFIQDGRTLVPMRGIFEVLGATLDWDGETRTVTAQRGARRVVLTIGANTAVVDGQTIALDVPAIIRENRTFVPMRFVAEALGAVVGWDAEIHTATVVDFKYVPEADSEAEAQLRTALRKGRPREADLSSHVELVVGDEAAPRGSLAVNVQGQVRGSQELYKVDQTVVYAGMSVASSSEVATRSGQTYVKAPGETAYRREDGPPNWDDLGFLAGFDPTRPFNYPFLSSIKAIRKGPATDLGPRVNLDLDGGWLNQAIATAAAAWKVDPSQVKFDRSQAEVQIKGGDGTVQQVQIQVRGTIDLPQADGSADRVPGRLSLRVAWQEPNRPLVMPALP